MKNRLSKKQLERLIREQIKEHPELLNENIFAKLWSKSKYMLSKLGSLEVGGKFFGRAATRAKADEDYQELLDNLDEQTLKTMKEFEKHMEKEYPEFPNMEDKFKFGAAAAEIEAVYEVLVKAVENWRKLTDNGKKPLSPANAKRDDNIDPQSANALVDALAGYVAKIIDFKLSDSYKTFNENKKLITTDEDLYFRLVLERLAKYGEKTATQKSLESKLLPLLLGAAGAATSVAATYATLAVVPDIPRVDDPAVLDKLPNPERWSRPIEKAIGETGAAIKADTLGGGFIEFTQKVASNFGDTSGGWYEDIKVAAEGMNKTPAELAEEMGNGVGRYGEAGFRGVGKGLSGEYARLAVTYEESGAGKAAEWFTGNPPSQEVLQYVQENAKSPELSDGIVNWQGEGSQGVGKGPVGSTIMGVEVKTLTLAAKPLMKYVVGALQVTGLASRGAAVTAGVINPIFAAIGLGGLLAGLSIGALRKKALKSSRGATLEDIRDRLEKFGEEGSAGEPAPPPIDPAEKEDAIKPILIKFDNDAIKVHTVRMSESVHYSQKDNVRAMADYMERLQGQVLIGRVEGDALEEAPSRAARIAAAMGQEGEVSTDDFQETFGQFSFKRYKIAGSAQTGKNAAGVRQISSIINKIQRSVNRSLVYNIKVQPYFAIDKSILDEETYKTDKAGVEAAFKQILQNKEILSMEDADISDDLKSLLNKYGMIGGKVRKSKVAPEKPKDKKKRAKKPKADAPVDAPAPDDEAPAPEEDPALAALRDLTSAGAPPRTPRGQRPSERGRVKRRDTIGTRGRRNIREDVDTQEDNILKETYNRWIEIAGITEEKKDD